jgi:thiol-disulfide isomerase/thioredoxin
MNFVSAALVFAAFSGINSSKPVDYKTAYQRAQEDGRPLLVLVTAEWCPPCQMMKQTTIPALVESNGFNDVHFATVDLDRSPVDARNIIGARGVPQLVLYEQKDGRWQTRILSGFQNVASVEAFLGHNNRTRTAGADSMISGK